MKHSMQLRRLTTGMLLLHSPAVSAATPAIAPAAVPATFTPTQSPAPAGSQRLVLD